MTEACLWMNRQGLNQGSSGNISVRSEAGILITPSSMAYDTIEPEEIVTFPLKGKPSQDLPLKPSPEWPFHQRLLQTRPDMPVVLHALPPYFSILAVQRRAIPARHYMIAAFWGMTCLWPTMV